MHAVGNICGDRYRYTSDLLALEASTPSRGCLPPDCCQISSPLKPDTWESLLSTHPDRKFVQFIVRGLRYGFRTGGRADLRSILQNMPAANLNADVVDKYILEERDHSRLVEVQPSQAGDVHVSKIGVIPKKRQRLIVDLSSPNGSSVNDFIDSSLCSLTLS